MNMDQKQNDNKSNLLQFSEAIKTTATRPIRARFEYTKFKTAVSF